MTGAMSVALLTAVSCSQTETDFDVAGGGKDQQVALGVSATINTGNATKAVVDYKKITYPKDNYGDAWCAPGMGVVLTNAAGTNWYNDDLSVYEGNHIWFMGDENGNNWISKKGPKGATYDENKVDYNLSVEVGRVYAYYPYNVSATFPTGGTGADFAETDLKIPVAVKTTGTIDATTNNAYKTWGGTSWVDKTSDYVVTLADLTENDYMYFDGKNAAGTATGRYVNNGHAGNAASANDNTNATNPGYSINLTMKHALSMVSFRVYDGGNLGTAGQVKFTKFAIADKDGAAEDAKFVVTSSKQMKIADGTLEKIDPVSTGTIERTITNYTLVQQIPSGAEGEYKFIEQAGVTGAAVSKIVSAIVYPMDFSAPGSSLKLTVTLQEGTNNPQDYTVNIPARKWEANKNYLYTLSAGRNKLNIVNVDVQEWTTEDGGELPL